MLIWGWRTVFRVVGSGVFSCPSCGADRNYERRRAQRFFTLFFIPLIPLKVIGEFVRCAYCKTDFRESVLARPTAAQFTDLLQNSVRGVMVNVLRRGGAGHPGARAIALQEIVSAGAAGYNEANLAQDMQVVPEDLSQMLAGLAGQLPEAGREALVLGAVRVAAADGPVDADERAVIDAVGAALGMTQTHVAGVVASVAPSQMTQTGFHGTGVQNPGLQNAMQDAAPRGFDQNATQVDTSSSMETMVIPPRPAPAAQDTSSMETMLIPPKPATDTSSLGTMPIPPKPAPVTQDTSSLETMVIPPKPPVDPADEPTHVTQEYPPHQR
ncbi:TerB family tellurite resistance protein [Catenulispora subtropica]|uniref:Zinc-ribbon 15 domain-containing protein n=1 Tax=Catenulispora subtropica TaxID=450798 RepID=A0ABN2R5Y8_9ACTN